MLSTVLWWRLVSCFLTSAVAVGLEVTSVYSVAMAITDFIFLCVVPVVM